MKDYQSDQVMEAILPLIAAQEHITYHQLTAICAWKSAQSVANITLNSEAAVIEVTGEAFDIVHNRQDPYKTRDALDVLGRLKGMASGVALRSTVLWALKPGQYPIIDKWAFKALYGKENLPGWPVIYEKYIRDVHWLSKKWDIPDPHEIDLQLMRKGSGALVGDNLFQNEQIPIIKAWQETWDLIKPFKKRIPDQTSPEFKQYQDLMSVSNREAQI